MKELIVIIDPQKDFTLQTGNYAKRHAGIKQITEVKKRLEHLVTVIDKKKIIVISNYRADQFEKGLSICIPGTSGYEIDLTIDNSTVILTKNEHSCFSSPAFTLYLKNNGVEHLILCGFLAEYCVKQTAIDGLDKGMIISLLPDCIGTGDDVQNRKEHMLLALKAKGIALINSSQWLSDNTF